MISGGNGLNFLQKTASDRFTSIKKKCVPPNIKLNKFSSSGIGNFQVHNVSGSAN